MRAPYLKTFSILAMFILFPQSFASEKDCHDQLKEGEGISEFSDLNLDIIHGITASNYNGGAIEVIDYYGEDENFVKFPEFKEAVFDDLGDPTEERLSVVKAKVVSRKELKGLRINSTENDDPEEKGIFIVNRTGAGCGFHYYTPKALMCGVESCSLDMGYKTNDRCGASKPQFVFIPLSSFDFVGDAIQDKEILVY